MAEIYPSVPVRKVGKFGTLLGIAKAHKLLGYMPAHSWREHVTA